MNGPNYHISWFTGLAMFSLAVILWLLQVAADLLGITAIFSTVIGLVAAIIFGLWGLIVCGPSFFGGKSANTKVLTSLATTVIGLIPFINIVPDIPIGIAVLIFTNRRDDREKFEEAQAAAQQATKQAAEAQAMAIASMQRRQAANDRRTLPTPANDS